MKHFRFIAHPPTGVEIEAEDEETAWIDFSDQRKLLHRFEVEEVKEESK